MAPAKQKAQKNAKNNLCADMTSPATVTFLTFQKLQEAGPDKTRRR